jgi:hypothetical protein
MFLGYFKESKAYFPMQNFLKKKTYFKNFFE